jgi:hypothetical protein
MKNKPCVINGVTYHPEIKNDWRFTLALDNGLTIFTVRLTQLPDIFYLRVTKIGWRWPLIRSVAMFQNKEALKEK